MGRVSKISKDKVDLRDKKIVLPPRSVTSVDLRVKCPPILDQGNLGSCTANAGVSQYQMMKQLETQRGFPVPSRLFLYYNTRLLEGTTGWDSGASIRDTVKAMAKYGVCPESLLPYKTGLYRNKPSQKCYTEGQKNQALIYCRLEQTKEALEGALQNGYPIIFGAIIYSNFRGNVISLPGPRDQLWGGHALLIVGYDQRGFIVRNSWGPKWGDQGYCYMSYDYVLSSLCFDFWVISDVE